MESSPKLVNWTLKLRASNNLQVNLTLAKIFLDWNLSFFISNEIIFRPIFDDSVLITVDKCLQFFQFDQKTWFEWCEKCQRNAQCKIRVPHFTLILLHIQLCAERFLCRY